MKKVFIFLTLLCITNANAQNKLNVFTKDGSLITYSFAQHPVIKYKNNNILIQTNTDEIIFPLSQLRKFTFNDNVTHVGELSYVSTKNDVLEIYDIKGILINKLKTNFNTIFIKDLPKGIYFIKSNNKTFKIIKK